MSNNNAIDNFITDANNFQGLETFYIRFWQRVRTFIQVAYGDDELRSFDSIVKIKWDSEKPDTDTHNRVLGYLEGLRVKVKQDNADSSKNLSKKTKQPLEFDGARVFIVHGHDKETKETVARFIQKIGLQPIILHEQPSSGLTIIEKLESFSNTDFAVILLTPDDIGGLAAEANKLQARARQNVILELGYFIGKLSRNRVCALYKKGVEIPSDYGSVVFIEFDEKGGWRTKLAQEFVHAGMPVELKGLLET